MRFALVETYLPTGVKNHTERRRRLRHHRYDRPNLGLLGRNNSKGELLGGRRKQKGFPPKSEKKSKPPKRRSNWGRGDNRVTVTKIYPTSLALRFSFLHKLLR